MQQQLFISRAEIFFSASSSPPWVNVRRRKTVCGGRQAGRHDISCCLMLLAHAVQYVLLQYISVHTGVSVQSTLQCSGYSISMYLFFFLGKEIERLLWSTAVSCYRYIYIRYAVLIWYTAGGHSVWLNLCCDKEGGKKMAKKWLKIDLKLRNKCYK